MGGTRLLNAAGLDPAIQAFVFPALFPADLLLILLTGSILFTGTSASWLPPSSSARPIGSTTPGPPVSWIGYLLSVVVALLIGYCDTTDGLTARLAIKVADGRLRYFLS